MAENFKYIKEYISTATGTEGSLLIVKKIYDNLIEEVDKSLIPRNEAAFVIGPSGIPGSSVDIDLVTADSMDVRKIAEGSEVIMDSAAYTSTNVKPAKYGVGIRITQEMLEDGKWNLLQQNIRVAGKRFAENENYLIRTALNGCSNSVSGGAQLTVSNVTRAMQYLEDYDYTATTMLVGMEVLNDLRNLDVFTDASKYGSAEMIRTGFVGSIYGMNVYKVSTNAGYTTTDVFIFDRNNAFCVVEKRPISIEQLSLPVYDMKGAVITQRIAAALIRDYAVCKITTS